MGNDLPANTLIQFIEGDFEATWDSTAQNRNIGSRGNFMFAMQTMILLEVACRLCRSDRSGTALNDFSVELASRDRRYFATLPATCYSASPEFQLPSLGSNPDRQLIGVLFDLIRNGQAHQYQQVRVQLTDGVDFQISLTGAGYGAILSQCLISGRPVDHLRKDRDTNQDLWLKVRSDVLYLDIRDSIRAANLLTRGLTISYLTRPRILGRGYQFTGAQLEAALSAGGI